MTKQTIVYDLENHTFPEHQKRLKKMVDKLNLNYHYGGTGVKTMYYTAGRRNGKSMVSQIYNANLCKEIVIDSMGMLTEKPKSKYKFSRAKWYEVEANFDTGRWSERIDWCAEHFGPDPKNPDAWSRWYTYGWNKIRIRDQKDYNWYVLRWGA